jgi:hypothetical protein
MTEVLDQPATDSLGWRAGLPDDLKQDEAFVPFKTVGDFAKAHKDTAAKAKDLEGKLANSIPKLGENATQEERNQFFNSLGRPEKPDGYELDGEDKNSKEWTGYWRNELHRIGVPKGQAKEISAAFNKQIGSMVEAHNAAIQKQIADTSAALKTELGDKYDASVQLASRLWKEWGKTEVDFDKAFASETSATRVTMIRFLLNVAAKTGEDTSLRGTGQRQESAKPGYDLSKFNLPPAKA